MMSWSKLLDPIRSTPPRFQNDVTKAEWGRSQFQKDFDRIIFANSFRRLGKKTQVHALHENDHIHSRLTHSLEVSCVGRTLGAAVGEMIADQLPEGLLPDDLGAIVQTACLSHDIGNPPFGHAGETAISNWFHEHSCDARLQALSSQQKIDDLSHFDGNAQGLRLVTKIERHFHQGGLRLTYPTLGAMIKYPWTSTTHPIKFSSFQSDIDTLHHIANHLGLIKANPNHTTDCQGTTAAGINIRTGAQIVRHPLSFLMEAADDICYAFIDLEDALALELIDFQDLEWVLEPLQAIWPEHTHKTLQEFSSRSAYTAILRSQAIGICIDAVAVGFIKNREALLSGTHQTPLLNRCIHSVQETIQRAKKLAEVKIFPNATRHLKHLGAEHTLRVLLDHFTDATFQLQQRKRLSSSATKIINLLNPHHPQAGAPLYEHYRSCLDYISGMTDQYALRLAKALDNNRWKKVISLPQAIIKQWTPSLRRFHEPP